MCTALCSTQFDITIKFSLCTDHCNYLMCTVLHDSGSKRITQGCTSQLERDAYDLFIECASGPQRTSCSSPTGPTVWCARSKCARLDSSLFLQEKGEDIISLAYSTESHSMFVYTWHTDYSGVSVRSFFRTDGQWKVCRQIDSNGRRPDGYVCAL